MIWNMVVMGLYLISLLIVKPYVRKGDDRFHLQVQVQRHFSVFFCCCFCSLFCVCCCLFCCCCLCCFFCFFLWVLANFCVSFAKVTLFSLAFVGYILQQEDPYVTAFASPAQMESLIAALLIFIVLSLLGSFVVIAGRNIFKIYRAYKDESNKLRLDDSLSLPSQSPSLSLSPSKDPSLSMPSKDPSLRNDPSHSSFRDLLRG